MCGAIFNVGPLICENSIWKLRLTLMSDNESPALFNMKQQLKEHQNLGIIADILQQCNQPDKAVIYYQKLLDELPQRHPLVSQIEKNSAEMPKLNLASPPNIQFLPVNLSEHMTQFAAAVLDTLCTLKSKILFIIDDESTIDLSQWSTKQTFIFTTSQFASSLEELPRNITLFTWENDTNNMDQRQRFASIDYLICQLADEIVRKYRFQANEYTKAKELSKAKEQDEQANRIYRALRRIHEKLTTNVTLWETVDSHAPILIWLLSKSENDQEEEDKDSSEKNFRDFFSSPRIFYDEYEYHYHLVQQENLNDMFIIIHSKYRESIAKGSRQFSNVKYVYRYGESTNDDEKIITNLDDLGYYLTSDLIDYYGKLGDQYRIHHQSEKAREMFVKAQKLCHLFCTNSFSEK